MTPPDPLAVIRAFVEAHAQPDPRTGLRQPVYYFPHIGGENLQHDALADPPPHVDEALLEELHIQGLLDIDYREHTCIVATWLVRLRDELRRQMREERGARAP